MATPLGAVMREREQTQMTGTPFFVLGCTLSISLFVKEVAIASILFLVRGVPLRRRPGRAAACGARTLRAHA